ncbi:alpha/beta hydrolase [Gilvimarinus algae]|uniref:Alpha/beta hydrolase fold domain-containing protein n=1 Tax=Gilvimarinus algae TaxID=3058037 RepID=A0ABT8TBJ1_9GAMM|nr:alpha/beta hydrolase fold domain-containing protein [Gilvimarinus sp. SDUM040014]MDO3381470.1 alpha/beta hydrolase fold domain-containing protein [Gilvimarinus sp. SDUM040014]
MKRFYSLLLAPLALVLAGSSLAQATDPNASARERRYLNPVFTETVRTADIVYGHNHNDTTNETEALTLRLFEPRDDLQEVRALLVLTPGGGFVQTDDAWMDDFGHALARAGYLVAINRYRLSAAIDTPERFFNALFKATSDQKAVIRYFVKDAQTENRYRVDTDNIFIGGHSAGAITSLYVAYLDKADGQIPAMTEAMQRHGGLEGDSGNSDVDFTLRGVINLSGLVGDLGMLDANEPALLSLHGDQDAVVPAGLGEGIFGSIPLHDYAQIIGLDHRLVIIPGALHNDTADPAVCEECIPIIKRFMFNRIEQTASP